MEWLFNNFQEIMACITGAMALASAVCSLTPTPKDDAVLAKVYKVIEVFALNVGKAKDTPK